MSEQNQGGSERTRQNLTAAAKSDVAYQQVAPAEPQSTPTSQENEADRLLRKIFFRSGPLPMAPDGSERAD